MLSGGFNDNGPVVDTGRKKFNRLEDELYSGYLIWCNTNTKLMV
jgi:hypothetical protein